MTLPVEQMQTAVASIFISYFNRAPEFEAMDHYTRLFIELLDQEGDSPTAEPDAFKKLSAQIYLDGTAHGEVPSGPTVTDVWYVTHLYRNILGREPDEEGLAYWTGQLESGALERPELVALIIDAAMNDSRDAAYVNNRTEVAIEFSSWENSRPSILDDLPYNAAEVLEGVNETRESVEAAQAKLYANTGTNGGTYTLTIGEDTIVGTDKNDVFNAPLVQDRAGDLVQTLEDIDDLDGGAGIDTLNATLNGSTPPAAPRVNNIEIFNLRATETSVLDFANISGVQEIWNSRSANTIALSYDNASIAATYGVRDTAATTSISFASNLGGDADVLNLIFSNAGTESRAAYILSGQAADIEVLNVTAQGTNFVNLDAFDAAKKLNLTTSGALELEIEDNDLTDITITGSGELNLVDTEAFAAVKIVDAADFSGDLTLDVSGSTDLETLVTGSGNDEITIDGTLLRSNRALDIDLGEGENLLRVAGIANHTHINDLVFKGAELSLAGITDVEIFDEAGGSIALGGNAKLNLDGVVVEAVGFGSEVQLDAHTLTLDNTADELQVVFLDDLDAGVGGTVDFGDAAETVVLVFNGVVGDTEAVAFEGEALTSLTVVANEDAKFLVDEHSTELEEVAIVAAENDVWLEVTLSGDADEDYSLVELLLEDISEAEDAVFLIDLVDTVSLTTIDVFGGKDTMFDIDASDAGYSGTVTINIGDFGVDADGTLGLGGFAYTANAVESTREVFKFIGDDFGEIEIEGFEAGAGANRDRIDFSLFDGIDSAEDLVIVDNSGDATITAAGGQFSGTIVLVGVAADAALVESFIFA